MKPDWDALGDLYASSDKVIIADVDCTADGKDLCEKFNVQGFPTIKSFSPPDEEGEDYDGGRDLDSLKAFAAELGPGCSVDTLENCSPEKKAELDKYIAMSAEERSTKLEELKTALKAKEEAHEELLKSLQAQYEESNEGVEKFKKETAPTIKLLKAATPKPAKAGGKDEV
jgi:hypothetical protein